MVEKGQRKETYWMSTPSYAQNNNHYYEGNLKDKLYMQQKVIFMKSMDVKIDWLTNM